MSCPLEPAKWSRGTGQRIACFDRCQLIIAGMSNIKEVHRKLPCIRLARGKFELTNQDSAGGKKSSVLTSSKQVGKGFEIRQLFSLEMALNIYEKGFTLQNPYQFAKSEKYEPFCVSNLLFWHQKWVAGARHGNSLIVRRVSPGRTIVVLF